MAYEDEAAFYRHAEKLADEWRARYGIGPDGLWTDDQLDRALADHGFPALASLPPGPRGMMADVSGPQVEDEPAVAATWRRVNASHLIGHAMLHNGERCGGCEDW